VFHVTIKRVESKGSKTKRSCSGVSVVNVVATPVGMEGEFDVLTTATSVTVPATLRITGFLVVIVAVAVASMLF